MLRKWTSLLITLFLLATLFAVLPAEAGTRPSRYFTRGNLIFGSDKVPTGRQSYTYRYGNSIVFRLRVRSFFRGFANPVPSRLIERSTAPATPAASPDTTLKPKPAPKPEPKPVPKPEPKPVPKPAPSVEKQIAGLTQAESQLLNMVNKERTDRGLAPLKADKELTRLARLKSKDMITNNYFSHQSPVYGSPFDMMRKAGVSYRIAGENLAGAGSATRAHNALMNSPGHRANILNARYTHIGIGGVSGGRFGMMFTQMFVGR